MRTLVILISLALTTIAAAEDTQGGKSSSDSSGKPQLSEVRSLVHTLQGHTDKLRELMSEYRDLVERKPDSDEALAKWGAALDRLLQRMDKARALVTEGTQRLKEAAKGTLPTALAKDVANAHNEAEAERTNAEQALAKSKADVARANKRAKQAPAQKEPKPSQNDELGDLEEP